MSNRIVWLCIAVALAGCTTGFHPRPPEPIGRPLSAAELAELTCEPGIIPAPEPAAYQSDDFEFAVKLPKGYLACVGNCSGHGVAIDLEGDGHKDCMAPDRGQGRAIAFYAGYTAWFVDLDERERNVRNLVLMRCADEPVERLQWLYRQRMGNRQAEGCKRWMADGTVMIDLAVLRKKPNEGSAAGIEIGAWLRTRPEYLTEDEKIFRAMLKNVWIRRDGPQDFRKTGRE